MKSSHLKENGNEAKICDDFILKNTSDFFFDSFFFSIFTNITFCPNKTYFSVSYANMLLGHTYWMHCESHHSGICHPYVATLCGHGIWCVVILRDYYMQIYDK